MAATPFPATFIPLIDYGAPGVPNVAIPETHQNQELWEIAVAIESGALLGDLVAVFRVALLEPTIDVSGDLAALIAVDWRAGKTIATPARQFAERFGFDLTEDEPEGSYMDLVREHGTLHHTAQGI